MQQEFRGVSYLFRIENEDENEPLWSRDLLQGFYWMLSADQ